jgi:hypothetical protein
MDRRMLVSVVSVVTAAACLTVGSAALTGTGARAEGAAKARVRETSDKQDLAPPQAAEPPAPPAVAPAPPPIVTPVPPTPPPAYTPTYPVAPPTTNEPRDGSLTVQEILQLRGLKKRIGGDNLKRVVDALAE